MKKKAKKAKKAKEAKNRIVIEVRGGVVNGVFWSPEANIDEWELIDFDNMEDEDLSDSQCEDKLKKAIKGLVGASYD